MLIPSCFFARGALLFCLLGAGEQGLGKTLVSSLERYVDPLPVPRRFVVPSVPPAFAELEAGAGKGVQTLFLQLGAHKAKLHRDLPETLEWGYEGTSPGPTIEVESGTPLEVHWLNTLPSPHVFPLPSGADRLDPDVRAVTHLHGAAVSQPSMTDRVHNNDGWPDAWTANGETQIAFYPNDQTARTLWYHDHAMGTTGRNVAAGLVGLYEIHDQVERSLGLPAGAYDLPLILRTHQVQDDGSLAYVDDISLEFWGNSTSVNGKLWPYLEVEPRRYRFRVVNAANARTFELKLYDTKDLAPGPEFVQVASDAGLLAAPVHLNQPGIANSLRFILAPAERAEIVVDFSAYAGKTLVLKNRGRDPADDEVDLPDVMQFRVAPKAQSADASTIPTTLVPVTALLPSQAAQTRQIVFDQMQMDGGMSMLALNYKHWQDPIEEQPVLGTTEIWELINPLIATHPFHVHLVQFQVLDRRLFDGAEFAATGKMVYLDDPVPPLPNELGWKDTVRALPQMVTRIIMRFGPYPGFYVYHCHILEHEDMDMMRPFQIKSSSSP